MSKSGLKAEVPSPMFIDCHTHAFSEKIADRVIAQLVDYYGIPTTNGGRMEDLLAAANDAGLDGLFLLMAATKPEQVKPAHDWLLGMAGLGEAALKERFKVERMPKIVYFGTFHPDDPGWEKELDRLKQAGIRGIKLHPEFQGIDLADPRLSPFFEAIQNDFILLTHVGDQRKSPENFSTPRKVAVIMDRFPKLRIIAAHLGGYCFWEEVLAELAGRELYLDTSSALPYISGELLREIITKHGSERLLFGSDYPLNAPGPERGLFDAKLDWLNSGAKDAICGGNARRLLAEVGIGI